jgi:hypothetical protein
MARDAKALKGLCCKKNPTRGGQAKIMLSFTYLFLLRPAFTDNIMAPWVSRLQYRFSIFPPPASRRHGRLTLGNVCAVCR